MSVRASPTIYEINTATWLHRLGRGLGRPVGLGDVPVSEWDALARLPVDAVWLMGVWQRSPIGRAIATGMPQLLAGYRAALPDLHEDDVLGSPYCVRDYVADEHFGGPDGLAAAREQLAHRGLALILDYVPNHIAADHPWVTDRPECLLAGSEHELVLHPEAFMSISGGVFAKGRDPYFDPWQDVLQLNAFSPSLREAAVETVVAIGDQCDGVRCDMAMLMTNEIFARTWGERAGPVPEAEYWPTLIDRCRQVHSDLLFMAEVYWDLEWTLQMQGFDLCYDKRLARVATTSPWRRRRLPAATRPIHREPRRAPRGDRVGVCEIARGRSRHVHAARRPPLSRWPTGGISDACPDPARAGAGRVARSRAARVLRAAGTRCRRRAARMPGLAPLRLHARVGRHAPRASCLVLVESGCTSPGGGQPLACPRHRPNPAGVVRPRRPELDPGRHTERGALRVLRR